MLCHKQWESELEFIQTSNFKLKSEWTRSYLLLNKFHDESQLQKKQTIEIERKEYKAEIKIPGCEGKFSRSPDMK